MKKIQQAVSFLIRENRPVVEEVKIERTLLPSQKNNFLFKN
jgi:hypothetical protein